MTGRLHVARAGTAQPRRPPVVLVHGWAMNGAVWDRFGEALSGAREVYRVDLPGHGCSPWDDRRSLAGWSAAVREAVPRGSVWIGWSLGVAIALRAALDAPGEVAGLVAIAGTPRFVRAGDWAHAMDPEVLEQFSENLAGDPARTVERFLGLQVRGGADATATLRRLKRALGAVPGARRAALEAGLELLKTTDLRPELAQLRVPACWLLGEKDTLVPAGMGWQLADWLPAARVEIVEGAGHAPFLSHPDAMLERVGRFMEVVDG